MKRFAKHYVLFHLLNDFSGSPKVLRDVAETLVKNGHEVTLVTSGKDGFLAGIGGVNYKYINYSWSPLKLITLLSFLVVQLRYFFYALFLKKESIIYINTLLPFGAALGGWIRGKRVVYHLHEPQVDPKPLFNILKKVASLTSTDQIFVSNYLKDVLNIHNNKRASVVYNCVSEEYYQYVSQVKERQEAFTVLMACSLKSYKGIYQFLDIARALPNIKFKLILNSSSSMLRHFLEQNSISKNCEIMGTQSSMIPHYQQASLVLNLSLKEHWIESFGLTLIEAMCFGIPVICPAVGGPLEVVENDQSGYHLDSLFPKEIECKIKELADDANLYNRLSKGAKIRAKQYSKATFSDKIYNFLEC